MTDEFFVAGPDPGAVQWYYSAASTSASCVSDVPGKTDFVKFCDGDSLLLESIYRKHAKQYSKQWWQQHYELMKRDGAKPAATIVQSPPEIQAALEPCGPVVRSGYYEADIANRKVFPIYWPEAPRMLMRGTWFVQTPGQQNTLIPLPHCLASKLEKAWQQKMFDSTQLSSNHKQQADGSYGTRIDLGGMLDNPYHAIFVDRNNMFLCSKDSHTVLKSLAPFKATRARLHRGHDAALERDTSAKKEQSEQADLSSFEARTVGMAVRHVVLAVHGIGQLMGGRTIADDAQAVRKGVNAMLDDYMPDEIGKGYIQVLPIQWRKNLDLEADQVAESIMPEGARSFRQLAHNTCVEVLMYMSPSHAQNILDSVATNLNCTFLRFVRRHTEFSGGISVLAYSLGSVLCYDLLAHQPAPEGSAAATALQHLSALHTLAEEARVRRQEAAVADVWDSADAGEGRGGGESDGGLDVKSAADAGQAQAKSNWLSYWGLFKKSGHGEDSPRDAEAEGAQDAQKRSVDGDPLPSRSSLSVGSEEDPMLKILAEATASMQAEAGGFWQGGANARRDSGEGRPRQEGDTAAPGQQDQVRQGEGNKASAPQRWLSKVVRKLGRGNSKDKQSLPEAVHLEQAAVQGGDHAAQRHASGGAAEAAQALAESEQASREACASANEDATGTCSDWRNVQAHACSPLGSDAGHAVLEGCRAAEQSGGGASAMPCCGAKTPAATHSPAFELEIESCPQGSGMDAADCEAPRSDGRRAQRADGAAGEAGEADGGAVVAFEDVMSAQELSAADRLVAVEGSADSCMDLQGKLRVLEAEAAVTTARIARLQAQMQENKEQRLMQPRPDSPFASPDFVSEPLHQVLRSLYTHQLSPGGASHGGLLGQGIATGSNDAIYHTYGMGELQDVDRTHDQPQAANPVLPDANMPDDERIAQARMLWPGSALHELDAHEQRPLTMQTLKYPELTFVVDNFIMIGSPTGLFAALRGVNPTKGRPLGSPAAGALYPGSGPGGLPVCRRMYNVFHPFDPVAYRMEPLIQKQDCPRPQLVPYHRGGRKLKMNIADAGDTMAKTIDKVAAALTFTFRRSKEEAAEPAAVEIAYQQCSVAPYVLGLPLLASLPAEQLPAMSPSLPVALLPRPQDRAACSAVTARSAPETFHVTDGRRIEDSPCELPARRFSSSCETLVRLIPDLVGNTDAGSILSCNVDSPRGPSLWPPVPPAHPSLQSHHTGSQSGRVAQRLRHSASYPHVPLASADSARAKLFVVNGAGGGDSTSARAFQNVASGTSRKHRRTLAGAGQGGVCAQGHGGSVGRLDFQLQEDFVETQFFGAFRAHFCYWKHEDVALLICRAACGYDVVDGSLESPSTPM